MDAWSVRYLEVACKTQNYVNHEGNFCKLRIYYSSQVFEKHTLYSILTYLIHKFCRTASTILYLLCIC